MYTSRDRTGLGFHESSIPCYFPSARSYNAACRSPSPSACRAACNQTCGCSVSIPHYARKTVRFDHRNPHLGRSRSVSRAGSHGTYNSDHLGSLYRHASPTFSRPKSVLDDNKTMEYANLNVLLRRLSILQLEMKGLLNGKSLKDRVQMMGQKLDDVDAHILPNAKPSPYKDVWLMENKHADCLQHAKCTHHVQKGEDHHVRQCAHHVQAAHPHPKEVQKWEIPQFRKKEEPLFHRHGESSPLRRLEYTQEDTITEEQEKGKAPCDAIVADSDWKEKKQIVQLWRDYNCDLHLRRIIDGSRKEAACRILEKVIHAQLTYYMLQYISAVAKGLMGDEKTHYLSFFKREGPFQNKPLNEGTYCELLTFVDRQPNPAKDVVKALEVSEEGLAEEGGRGGYDPNGIGDIRGQMRIFMSVVAAAAAALPLSTNPPAVSQADDDEAIFTKDFLHDLIKAADQGKLGALQHAHKLIKLACFLALKRVESSNE